MTKTDSFAPEMNNKSTKKTFSQRHLPVPVRDHLGGFGFIAQRLGNQHVGPFTFNGIRFLLGALTVSPLLFIVRRAEKKDLSASEISATETRNKTRAMRRAWIIGSLICGLALLLERVFSKSV